MESKKRIIVNADDFGLDTAINMAICRGYRDGLITSASLMPGIRVAPAYSHALAVIAEAPGLDVGLHFTLVGAADLPKNHSEFLTQKLQGGFHSSRIESILRRQLDTLLGDRVAVSRIDSHQHLHALPSVMRVVARVASEYGIKAVRLPREYHGYAGAPASRVAASRILAALSELGRRELDCAGILYTDHFSGMAISGRLTPSSLKSILQQVRPGTTEILCHPGTDNNRLGRKFDWGYDWEGELAAVTDASVVQEVADLGIIKMSFSQMITKMAG